MQEQQSTRKKKTRITARFFLLFFSLVIISVIGYFFWQTTQRQLPNLHGWESTAVLDFASSHHIDVYFEFIYSNDMAPTRILSQSVPPRTAIAEGMRLTVEVSKGVEVR